MTTPGHDAAGPSPDAAAGPLAEALRDEVRLLDELADQLGRQRTAVTERDAQAVEDSVHAVQRVLLTLAEARRRRHLVAHALGAPPRTPVNTLEQALPGIPAEAIQAREALRARARSLADDLALNRKLLREALRTGDPRQRGPGDARGEPLSYDAAARPVERTSSGEFLDRQV